MLKLHRRFRFDQASVLTVKKSGTFPSTGLVAYWRLDENTGTTAVDQKGAWNGTLTNSPTWGTGKINSGVTFAAGTNNVQTGYGTPGFTNVSVAFWISCAAAASQSSFAGLFAIRHITDNVSAFQIQKNGTLNSVRLTINTTNTSTLGTWNAFADGTFHHVAVTYDDPNNQSKMYVDGALIDTQTAATGWVASTTQFLFGASADATPIGLVGTMDEVGVWNAVLSATDVSNLYNSGAGVQF